jgi:hypothetical protein
VTNFSPALTKLLVSGSSSTEKALVVGVAINAMKNIVNKVNFTEEYYIVYYN